jgi:hypothetical protein
MQQHRRWVASALLGPARPAARMGFNDGSSYREGIPRAPEAAAG